MLLATRVELASSQASGAPPPPFDLSTRALTGWQDAPFTGSPWTPIASAGTSGANGDLAEATNPPSTSAPLNGLTGAACDGTNDQLSNATPIADYVSAPAGSLAVLFNATSADADGGPTVYYTAAALFSDNADGFTALTYNAGGVRLGCFNGANFNGPTAACGTGAPHLAMARWNNTTVEVRVDSGAWVTMARTVTLSGGGIRMGANYDASAFFHGTIYGRVTEQARWSDAEADEVKDAFCSKYGLAL